MMGRRHQKSLSQCFAKLTPELGSELRVAIRNDRLRYPVESDNFFYEKSGDILGRRVGTGRDEVDHSCHSADYQEDIVVSSDLDERSSEIHPDTFPRS